MTSRSLTGLAPVRLEPRPHPPLPRGGEKGVGAYRGVCPRMNSYLPSSLERSDAATTALMTAARMPPCSKACTPAMVVPPGLVT